MKSIFSKFLYLFNRREKLQIVVLLILILVGALLETFVVGLIYPFISVLKRPEIIHEHWMSSWVYRVMRAGSDKEFIVWIAVGLIGVYLLKNVYLIFLAYTQSRFIFNKQRMFSRRFFTFYLHQPYTFHLQRNTAELLNKINGVIPSLFSSFLLFALMFVIETITTISILGLLILIKPLPAIITVSILGTFIFAFYRILRKKIGELGKLSQHYGEKMIQWVNQGLGGLKETKVLGREEFFINTFDKNSKGLARVQLFMHVINQLPRSFLETICMISMLLIMLLIIVQNKEIQSIIPTLSIFAMAAFRIIPSMNRIFAATAVLRFNSYSVEVVYNDLVSLNKDLNTNDVAKRADATETVIVFNKVIELKNVYYQYPNANRLALNDISIKIPQHYSVGFVGPSGAGKTTLVDIILGLLPPTQGKMLVDGKDIQDNLASWQRRIGYIPQNIYLSDDTIRCNIAFGLPDEQIDEEKVWSALESAQLEELVNSFSDKINTFIGERGIRLSGGQCQRIGIARALYHNPEVLVMDEGTASLDNETEREIMKAMRRLGGKKTLIIIAHRLSTVKNCDLLYFVSDGKVVNYGTYDELLINSVDFKEMVMSTEYE
ncbi:MAG: hypothetical protein A2W74_08060 [Planctomycetes bacterium RIFCSPLOWO2_12_38_17]|nr:MAG: hypothetical protein A2W74_08060 [Planctomycetes bacterium RIFCSPLOWO2_12_38_17]